MIGGALPAALGANWLASAWDQNAGLFAATPISAVLEEVSLSWLLDALSCPPVARARSRPERRSPNSQRWLRRVMRR